MKAKLFLARLLVTVMLLNSVLPAYASVNTLSGTDEPTIVETQIDGDSAKYTVATDSEAEEIEQVIVQDDDPVIDDEGDQEIVETISENYEVEIDTSDLPDNDELLDGFIENLYEGAMLAVRIYSADGTLAGQFYGFNWMFTNAGELLVMTASIQAGQIMPVILRFPNGQWMPPAV